LDRYGHLWPTLDDALTAGLDETIRVAGKADRTQVACPGTGEATDGL
jgi:hypothetical protein